MDRGRDASGFIIEWSGDAKSGKSAPNEGTGPGAAGTDLTAKAKELMFAADTKRNDALAANVKKFGWDLTAFLRGLKKSSQEQWSPHVELLKECVKGNRLFPNEIEPRGISVSPEMAKLVIYHTRKQGEIDAQFVTDAGAIRDAFAAKMGEIQSQAETIGQTKIVEESKEAIKDAGDLGSWVEKMGLVFKPEEKELDFDRDSDDDE
jgi:hypothetical protein